MEGFREAAGLSEQSRRARVGDVPDAWNELDESEESRVELGVSAWTRRDRLERIASAERDRRAGRVELALAVLGEGSEWPARVVMALARLPRHEGAETRVLLEQSLDAWAAECGLDSLGVFETSEAADPVSVPQSSDEVSATQATQVTQDADALPALESLETDTRVDSLDTPLEHDELERAFAEAEAQTDEMHDVNSVAERVLLGQDLNEDDFADSGLVPVDAAPRPRDAAETPPAESTTPADPAARPIASPSASTDDRLEGASEGADQVDAAWGAAPIWPEPRAFDSFREEAEALRADFDAIAPEPDRSVAGANAGGTDVYTETDPETMDATGQASGRSRATVLATLERWLVNLEKSRAGRAK